MKTKSLILLGVFALCLSTYSCKNSSDNDISIPEKGVTLHHDEIYQIKATSDNPLTYETKDPFVATVASTGKVKADHVGKTQIKVSDDKYVKDFDVEVTPEYHLYREVSVTLNKDTKDDIVKQIGEPDGEDSESFYYKNFDTNILALMFEYNEDKTIKAYGYTFKRLPSTDEMVGFLDERFELYFTDKKGDLIVFMNALTSDKATEMIIVGATGNRLSILYTPPFTDNSNAIREFKMIKSLKGNKSPEVAKFIKDLKNKYVK